MPRRITLGTPKSAQERRASFSWRRRRDIDPKTINSIDALPDLLTGVRAKIRVGLQIKDGVQTPVVRTVLGPAGPERQADEPHDNAE